jgi:cytochrome P450
MSGQGRVYRGVPVADRVVMDFDQHSEAYKQGFPEITHELHSRCPAVWTEGHGGYWVVAGRDLLGELAKHPELLSNDRDLTGERPMYGGVAIPAPPPGGQRGGFLEMDPPLQLEYRHVLNPFLSPAAIDRWGPMVAELVGSCVDAVIERGRIDFVDDLANVVPAVLTMGLLGVPLADWVVYCEPAHAMVYTPPTSPAFHQVLAGMIGMAEGLAAGVAAARAGWSRGMIRALVDAQAGGAAFTDDDIMGTLTLLIGGGFDTTTALTAHALDWLEGRSAERSRLLAEPGLIDSATEEFVRWATPAQGGGRTVTQDCTVEGISFREGDRVWMAYAAANHDPEAFDDPDDIVIDRFPNRHAAFGLGVHRCIGSNLARMTFKTMLTEVLTRLPAYEIERDDIVRYEDIGTINGYRHLPARFVPGRPRGSPLDEVIARWQTIVDGEEFWA